LIETLFNVIRPQLPTSKTWLTPVWYWRSRTRVYVYEGESRSIQPVVSLGAVQSRTIVSMFQPRALIESIRVSCAYSKARFWPCFSTSPTAANPRKPYVVPQPPKAGPTESLIRPVPLCRDMLKFALIDGLMREDLLESVLPPLQPISSFA